MNVWVSHDAAAQFAVHLFHSRVGTTTGLDYWTHPNCKIHLFQYRTEAKCTYSISYFTNTAPYSIFPGVSKGQRSRNVPSTIYASTKVQSSDCTHLFLTPHAN